MGFSPFGLVVSVAVLAPNLLLLVFPPRTERPTARIPWPLSWLERGGQALGVVVPAITTPGQLVWPWCVVVVAAILGYYSLWWRYLGRDRSWAALYRPLGRIPVPMAIFPVVAFAATAAWLSNPWIALAAAIIAAGHIPASQLISRQVLRSA
jgi:hypothetical protein